MPKIRVVTDDVLRHVLCPLLWTCAKGTVWVASGDGVGIEGPHTRNMCGCVNGTPGVCTGPGKGEKGATIALPLG